MNKAFKPTKEMLQATETLLRSMAIVQTITPIVHGYQKKNLDAILPINNRGKLITDLNNTYKMNNKDFTTWTNLNNTDRIIAKLYVNNPEYCPLLIAQDLQRQAENLFIEAMLPITGITAARLNIKIGYRQKMIDLSLKLLTRYIDHKKVKAEILKGTIKC